MNATRPSGAGGDAFGDPNGIRKLPRHHDDHSARAIIEARGTTAAGVFTFDGEGRAIAFESRRPRDVGGRSEPTPWHVVLEGHVRMNGAEIPARGNVSWLLPDGPLEYGRFEIAAARFEQ